MEPEWKILLRDRLRAEGRWEAASRRRYERLNELKAQGVESLAERSDLAWKTIAEEFPPLEVAVSKQVAFEAAAPPAPPIPWKGLPTAAEFEAEVAWVHQQYILIVEETARGRIIHWKRATEPPPSTGACSLALWAAENRTAFYKDVLPRAKASAVKDDQAELREERKSIAEIDRILEAMAAAR
jgi:hypothetical protein